MTLKTSMRSMKKTLVLIAVATGLALTAQPALAAGGAKHPRSGGFSFEGPFGTFDQAQLQRGYKVYREVCASCHGMDLMYFRTLAEPGGPFYDPDQENPAANRFVKVLAAEVQVPDIDSETGEAIMRDAVPADRFPNPYPNATAAAAGNGGAMPPDLSVMAKARHDGANYIYSLLSGYGEPPAGLEIRPGQYYNPYMAGDLASYWSGDRHHVPPGGFIAMPPPLSDDQVSFDDGTPSTVDQMARDVSAFIAWASEPKATERKQTGLAVMLFLAIFTVLTWFSYKAVWRDTAH